jgi:hypothetical protein
MSEIDVERMMQTLRSDKLKAAELIAQVSEAVASTNGAEQQMGPVKALVDELLQETTPLNKALLITDRRSPISTLPSV